jgi:hypothetical protein
MPIILLLEILLDASTAGVIIAYYPHLSYENQRLTLATMPLPSVQTRIEFIHS